MENLFLDACEQGLTSTIFKFLRKSIDVNLTDSNGCTGLMKACLNGHYEIIKLLLDANADINKKDFYGQNALHYAIRSNNEKVVKLLLSNKIETNVNNKLTSMKPINYSILTVPQELSNPSNKFIEKEYIKQNKSIQRHLNTECLNLTTIERANEFVEDRIIGMINRFNNMELSDLESDGDDEPKGEVYKKTKKKKKGKKSKSGKKGGGKKGKKKKK